MRFLVDRCAGSRLARWLREAGHDVTDASEMMKDPGDAQLLAVAARERRILITVDQDFGGLIFQERQAHAGLIRLPDCRAEQRITILAQLLVEQREHIEAGAVITVRDGRVRISSSGN